MSEKNVNNKIIKEKDRIVFDLKIKKDDDSYHQKFINKTITLGKEEIFPGFDENIIGIDLSEDNKFEFELSINEPKVVFDETLEPGIYSFGFRIHNKEDSETREKLDMKSMKDSYNDKQKIRELEEINKNLNSKIEKLEAEKQLSEQIFKAKAEELAKSAANKVEILKEEIKNKAKEDVEYKTKFAIQKLIDDLLSPLNNLYVAVEAGSKMSDPNVSAYVKGFQMLTSQIFNTLESHGIKVIEPQIGEIYNPEIHQAQEVVEDPTFQKDRIVKLISRGYKLHDRVLRPAIVIVSKG